MEIVDFNGWANCIRLFNTSMELVVTTDIGPRIIRCGLINGKNLLHVSDTDKGKTGGTEWRIYGGHRLWHAPEVMARTYSPDNDPVEFNWDGKTLKLRQDVEMRTGIAKEIEITLDPVDDHVEILHRLINTNLWTIRTSPWAITAHAAGSRAILPQEPYIEPEENLLPARPVVLWNYTRMNDTRWSWGEKYIQMKHDPLILSEQKIGILNKQGWAACYGHGTIMVKLFEYAHDAVYPDYGCNNEIYVNGTFLEIESLGPFSEMEPGCAVEHTEHWYLRKPEKTPPDDSEPSVDNCIMPVIRSILKKSI
jgi:hypothetical protein